MSTTIKPDDFLANIVKWLGPEGGKWRFYKNKADWLTHNRNGAGNNTNATPGGFGPLEGAAAHNTASTSQTGMLVYLYTGDSARALPGPLCNWAVLKTGEVVLMGWGTSNATGPGDPKVRPLIQNDKMPLNSEILPTTAGPTDPRAILYAPYLQGWEACHAAEGPTPEQYESILLMACAYLMTLGGPDQGYTGGSIVMHRELTTTRSDPQGTPKNGKMRRDINEKLALGPAPRPPEPPVTKKPSTVTLTPDKDAITKGETVGLAAKALPAQAGTHILYYKAGTMTSWAEWTRVKTSDGTAKVLNTPSMNVNYMTSWWPDNPAFEDSVAAYATVAVVDLVRLMTEQRDLQVRVKELEDAAAAPGTAQTLTPGDLAP